MTPGGGGITAPARPRYLRQRRWLVSENRNNANNAKTASNMSYIFYYASTTSTVQRRLVNNAIRVLHSFPDILFPFKANPI